VDWVRQAQFEVGDLRDCLEFELDDINRFPAFLDPLQQGIQALYQSMLDGDYLFGREDLPFMDLVIRFADQIPFHDLLKQINETHRRGIDLDGEG
jgi:hypothetical protein